VQKELADHGLGVGTRVVLVMNQSETSCKIGTFPIEIKPERGQARLVLTL